MCETLIIDSYNKLENVMKNRIRVSSLLVLFSLFLVFGRAEAKDSTSEPLPAPVARLHTDDARKNLDLGSGGLRDGDQVAGKVRELGGASVSRVVNRPGDGAPRWVRFAGQGEVEIELPKAVLREQDDGITVYACRFRPALGSSKDDRTELEMGGALLCYSYMDDRPANRIAGLMVYDAESSQAGESEEDGWIHTGVYFPVRANGQVQMHAELAARLDSRSKTWDLYVNGRLKVSGLGYKPDLERFVVKSSGSGESSIGRLWIGDENPLFEDEDRDGLPDDGLGG